MPTREDASGSGVTADGSRSRDQLVTENEQLKRLADDLARENRSLREQIKFLTTHDKIRAGIAGETLISGLLNGKVTAFTASEDVVLDDGRRIEVKFSSLNLAVAGGHTKRWSWSRLFGNGGKKQYDYVVLIGEKDERWKQFYREPEAPFVFFVVPYAAVQALTTSTDAGRFRAIQLTTNPLKARNSNAAALFQHYQRTVAELEAELGMTSAAPRARARSSQRKMPSAE